MFSFNSQSSPLVVAATLLVLLGVCSVSARAGHSFTDINQRLTADEVKLRRQRVDPQLVVDMVSVLGRLSKGCFVASMDKSDSAQVECYRRAVNTMTSKKPNIMKVYEQMEVDMRICAWTTFSAMSLEKMAKITLEARDKVAKDCMAAWVLQQNQHH